MTNLGLGLTCHWGEQFLSGACLSLRGPVPAQQVSRQVSCGWRTPPWKVSSLGGRSRPAFGPGPVLKCPGTCCMRVPRLRPTRTWQVCLGDFVVWTSEARPPQTPTSLGQYFQDAVSPRGLPPLLRWTEAPGQTFRDSPQLPAPVHESPSPTGKGRLSGGRGLTPWAVPTNLPGGKRCSLASERERGEGHA